MSPLRLAAAVLTVLVAAGEAGAVRLPLRHHPWVADTRVIWCGKQDAAGSLRIDLDRFVASPDPPPRWSRRFVEVLVHSGDGYEVAFTMSSRFRHDLSELTTYRASSRGRTPARLRAHWTENAIDHLEFRISPRALRVMATVTTGAETRRGGRLVSLDEVTGVAINPRD